MPSIKDYSIGNLGVKNFHPKNRFRRFLSLNLFTRSLRIELFLLTVVFVTVSASQSFLKRARELKTIF